MAKDLIVQLDTSDSAPPLRLDAAHSLTYFLGKAYWATNADQDTSWASAILAPTMEQGTSTINNNGKGAVEAWAAWCDSETRREARKSLQESFRWLRRATRVVERDVKSGIIRPRGRQLKERAEERKHG
jgi:hypothetical protein